MAPRYSGLSMLYAEPGGMPKPFEVVSPVAALPIYTVTELGFEMVAPSLAALAAKRRIPLAVAGTVTWLGVRVVETSGEVVIEPEIDVTRGEPEIPMA